MLYQAIAGNTISPILASQQFRRLFLIKSKKKTPHLEYWPILVSYYQTTLLKFSQMAFLIFIPLCCQSTEAQHRYSQRYLTEKAKRELPSSNLMSTWITDRFCFKP